MKKIDNSDQVREEIEAFARKHKVTYKRTRLNDVADKKASQQTTSGTIANLCHT